MHRRFGRRKSRPATWAGSTERNDAYQAAIELLVRNRDASGELPDGAVVREELHAYLQRRLAREHHLYFPSFTGAPF